MEKKVLLVDLDPQASLTFSLIAPDRWEEELADERTIKQWFDTADVGDEIAMDNLLVEDMRINQVLASRDRVGRVWLIASHLGLINVDLELATQLGGANMTQAKRNYVRVHQRLAKGLAELDQDAFDIVLRTSIS
jgi:chromosome partitioning protein